MRFKLLFFGILLFFESFILDFLDITILSLFIKEVGLEKLPIIIIITELATPLIVMITSKLLRSTSKAEYVLLGYYLSVITYMYTTLVLYKFWSNSYSIMFLMIIFKVMNVSGHIIVWNIIASFFNVFDAKNFYPSFNLIGDVGTISAALSIKYILQNKDILTISNFVLLLILLILSLVVFLIFAKSRYREFGSFTVNKINKVNEFYKIPEILKNKIFIFLGILVAIEFAFELITSYQVKFVLGQNYKSLEDVNNIISNYVIFKSTAVIVIGILFAKILNRFVNTSSSYIFYSIVVTILALILSLYGDSLPLVFGVGVLWYLTSNMFSIVAYEKIMNSFVPSSRVSLRVLYNGYTFPLIGLLIGTILLYCHTYESFFILNIVRFFIGIIAIYLAIKFKNYYKEFHVKNLFSRDKQQVIKSLQALGERNNHEAIDPLLEMLHNSQNLQIRKNAILSLGEIRIATILQVLFDEIKLGNEYQQIATMRAMSNFNSFLVHEFLINLLYGKNIKSLNVRLSLLRVLYDLMGDNIVPTLVTFLHNNDPRIVANTIEAMSPTKDKRIIEILEPFLTSDNNRIRANTIIVLYKFNECVGLCDSTLLSMATSKNYLLNNTFAYIVGRLRLRKYTKMIFQLATSKRQSTQINCAFTLCKLEMSQGYKIFADIFKSNVESTIKSSLAHYSQLDIAIRIRIIELFIRNEGDPIMLIKQLQNTAFDFFDDIEFLEKMTFLEI